MQYNFRDIEKKWQQHWKATGVYEVSNDSQKPKCYVLDMFPYPSGAGLHVGHPLGYIASDIYARFKRLKGFNVLHPMGYDAFGLPAEQYAIDHGIHPAVSTENNINNFRKQLDNIGFCFDWSREIRTCDPKYYKWTQWIFLKLFHSFYNRNENKAEPIENLIAAFEKEGNANHQFPGTSYQLPAAGNRKPETGNQFTADEWRSFDEFTLQDILMQYRLAYCGLGEVNWCEALGTVLANDEVINGVSERGGYPVVKKKLRQWYLRITEYADRLLEGLEQVDFSEAMKEMQTNWIGKSSGAEISFRLTPNPSPRGEGSNSPLTERSNKLSGNFFKTADTNYWQTLKQYGRDNRKNPTEAEDILWQRLRNNQLGAKVRRQHSVYGFIVDFAFLDVKLVIEVDGDYHNKADQKIYDEARTKFLKEFDLDLLRFTNEEVINNEEQVISSIQAEIQKRKQNRISEAGLPLLREEKGLGDEAQIKVYTTRPDTIFGVDFMVIAPEHELVEQITTAEQKKAVEEYIAYVKSRSERERMAEKKISGVFTGGYCIHPFSGRQIPIWISEYVLIGYGTGAIMAVPCGDERDHKFAKHFNIPITNIIGKYYDGEEANPTKDAILENSDFLNGMVMKDAIDVVIKKLEELDIGERKVNYKMRDAAFSRQRYWGEPVPIVWENGIAYPLDEKELPLELPHVETYKPGAEGEGPLANIPEWTARNLETNTMPGYAGSSWYFLRYMDPFNDATFCDRKISDYWGQVDLYIGGTEHAVGHLLYSRMWTKVLFDLNLIGHDEPYKKLVNQGMIQGSSRIIFRIQLVNGYDDDKETIATVYVSSGQVQKLREDNINIMNIEEAKRLYFKDFKIEQEINGIGIAWLHVDVNIVDDHDLNIDLFRNWRSEYADAHFIFEDGSSSVSTSNYSDKKFVCRDIVEKMSKRYYNVVNPDDLCDKYGADTFRMYEMFLGPVEMSKPWDTKGIEGVHRFLKKFWRLFVDEEKGLAVTNEAPTNEELKVLHKTIKKIRDDTERFSFNTGVSAFMIATNELTDLKCHKRKILEPLLILLASYAPHISEELWHLLGHSTSVVDAVYPTFEEKYVKESSKTYPVAINGKTRTELNIDLDATQQQVEEMVLSNDVVKKWMEGKQPKKVIYVKNKMVNVVV
jgi:leucyl-tRNA synthetase